MPTICREQMAALEAAAVDRFSNESVAWLSEQAAAWCASRTRAEVKDHVTAVIWFSRRHHIDAADNMQKLMLYSALYGITEREIHLPFERLTHPGLDEDYRVEQFRLAVTQDRHPIRITLDTDLDTLRAHNDEHADWNRW